MAFIDGGYFICMPVNVYLVTETRWPLRSGTDEEGMRSLATLK
jgi:hypothetical protein